MEFTEKVNSADVVRPVATNGFYTIGYINNTPAQWAGTIPMIAKSITLS